MSRLEHRLCGYTPLAPGCDDVECLLHRIEVARFRGWDVGHLEVRLDAVLEASLLDVVGADADTVDRERLA